MWKNRCFLWVNLTNVVRNAWKMFVEQNQIESFWNSTYESSIFRQHHESCINKLCTQWPHRPLMWFHSCKRGLNSLPEGIVKRGWRHFKPALVFNPSHQGVAFKNRVLIGVDLCACYSLIAHPCGRQRVICRHGEFAVVKERRGEAIKVHNPQMQCGRIILYSSVTTGDSTLIR